MNKLIYIYIVLFVFIFAYFSCNKGKTNEEEQIEYVIENNLGKQLFIPENIITYKPFNNYFADSLMISNSEYKIYSLVNASCSVCVDNIIKWNLLYDEFKNKKIPIVLIFKSDDNFELLKFACEKGIVRGFPYPFFLDTDNSFYKKNIFMKVNKHLETVLTDKNNRIILFGNPLFNANIKKKYMEIIGNNDFKSN